MYHFIFFPFFHLDSFSSTFSTRVSYCYSLLLCSCLSLQNEQCSTDVVPGKIITIRVEAESGKAVAIATANKINAICCKRNFLAIVVPKPWQTEFYDAIFSSFMSVKILLFYIITYIRYSTKNNIEREKIKLQ